MQLKLFKTLWGFEGSYESAALLAFEAGFQGLECRAPREKEDRAKLAAALARYELDYIAEICSCGSYVPERWATPAEHLRDIETKAALAREFKPRLCNVICGCDAWDEATQLDFFSQALEIGARQNLALSFETHRSRSLFNPWITAKVAAHLPELRLTADYSHWTVVCERVLETEWDILTALAPQVRHIHARVGYDQGPQVPHPAAPEYAKELAFQQKCWAAVWAAQKAQGYKVSTMTPEFGPDGYLHTLPFTRMPIGDLWEINRWIGHLEQEHFKSFLAGQAGQDGQDGQAAG